MPSKITFVVTSTSKKLLRCCALKKFNDKSRDSMINSVRNFSIGVNRKMRFVQYKAKAGGPQHLGAQLSADGDVFDISAVDSSIPNSLVKFLAAGDGVVEKAKRIVAAGKSVLPLNSIELLSPITNPDKVACIGFNYTGHCDELKAPHPTQPTVFSKFSSSITGPYSNIVIPKLSNKVDWEVELVIVIGKQAKLIEREQANDCIFGYTVAQDVTARDWVSGNSGQFLLAKGMDTFCPLGPAVVMKEDIKDVHNLNIQTRVNGELKQNSNTKEMIFKTDFLVSYISQIVAAGKSIIPLSDITLLAPITKPDKVACVGLNYTGHCDEQNIPYPKEPMIFSKFSSCITGPYDNIHLPQISDRVDWEVELAVVIGKQAKAIRPDQTDKYIFGYTVAQDISARDWQKERNNGQFLLGKSMDSFCPIGPAVVTRDCLHNVNNLDVKTWVNGKLRQHGNTSEMIFKVDFLVSYLSQIITLYPGDLILTGTPSGVGMHRNPPQYLKSGDVLESEIEGIGKLKNVAV